MGSPWAQRIDTGRFAPPAMGAMGAMGHHVLAGVGPEAPWHPLAGGIHSREARRGIFPSYSLGMPSQDGPQILGDH